MTFWSSGDLYVINNTRLNRALFIKGFCRLKKILIFAREFAGVAQLVEHNLAKVRVAGSSPVFRSKTLQDRKILEAFVFYDISKMMF